MKRGGFESEDARRAALAGAAAACRSERALDCLALDLSQRTALAGERVSEQCGDGREPAHILVAQLATREERESAPRFARSRERHGGEATCAVSAEPCRLGEPQTREIRARQEGCAPRHHVAHRPGAQREALEGAIEPGGQPGARLEVEAAGAVGALLPEGAGRALIPWAHQPDTAQNGIERR